MIKAFDRDARDFSSNGNRIIRAESCIVTREADGSITADISVAHIYSDSLAVMDIITIDTPEGLNEPFRIYEIKDTGKKLKVSAKHLCADIENYILTELNVSQQTPAAICAAIQNAVCARYGQNISFSLDVTNGASLFDFECSDEPLADAISALASLIGANVYCQGTNVTLKNTPGTDSEIVIRYRKNLRGIEATYDTSEVCTRIIPRGDEDVTLDPVYLDYVFPAGADNYMVEYTRAVSFSQDLEQGEEEEEEAYHERIRTKLRQQAQEYLDAHHAPKASYSIDTATSGVPVTALKVGDLVHVADERIGIEDSLLAVRATEYDAVRGIITRIELGEGSLKLSDLSNIFGASVNREIAATKNATAALGRRVTSNETATEGLDVRTTENETAIQTTNEIKQDKVLTSTGGSKRFTIQVDDDGNLSAVEVEEEEESNG